jgi:hypothetical protein
MSKTKPEYREEPEAKARFGSAVKALFQAPKIASKKEKPQVVKPATLRNSKRRDKG